MIFVTVGTHEQQFNRLVEYIDKLKGEGTIKEDVVVQTGFSTYEPKHCQWSKLFPYQNMVKFVTEARIVISHGGPSSFIMPLQLSKVPIVVPRQKMYNEHVNNHQVDFSKAVAELQGNIIVADEMEKLKYTILNYDTIVKSMPAGMKSNNEKFNMEFTTMVDELFKEGK
jgi:UDP-N-acetylglucosamine transferase subunit ALG13